MSAVVGALGALKGPLHGGAPGPALDMVFEIGDAGARRGGAPQEDSSAASSSWASATASTRSAIRAPTSSRPPRSSCSARGRHALYSWRAPVEATALRLLEEHKPGRRLQTNVEFYTALLLHGLGLTPRSSRRCSRSVVSAAGSRTPSSSVGEPDNPAASEYIGPRGSRVPVPRSPISSSFSFDQPGLNGS